MIRSNSVGEELQHKPGDLEHTVQVQAKLKEQVIKLYSGVIEFQAQAVCYYFHDWGIRTVQNIVKAKDWPGLLDQINQSEKECWDLINRINSDRSKNRSSKQVIDSRLFIGAYADAVNIGPPRADATVERATCCKCRFRR
jgi:N-terminal domain of NWD NACHT-NTPase